MSADNRLKMEQAYQDVMAGGGTHFAYGYLYKTIVSGRHSTSGLQAIARGVEKALKDKSYR